MYKVVIRRSFDGAFGKHTRSFNDVYDVSDMDGLALVLKEAQNMANEEVYMLTNGKPDGSRATVSVISIKRV